ncbi:MAG TPA: VWA domain-containing protein, partial [Firmicutes bacterium]|nr:VWA domain-containing protein [Bacillota bacterium]
MRFGSEEAFLLAWILGPLFIYFAYRIFRVLRNLYRHTDRPIREKLFGGVSAPLIITRNILLAAAFVFFMIAAARPWGSPVKTEMHYSGIDIMLLMDVSGSMGAIDIKPNRMTAVKSGISRFVDELYGDRVGIIVFSGTYFLQCPLTVDYGAVKMMIESLQPDMLEKGGTAVGDTIKAGVERLKKKAGESRIMILISDGENTTGMAPEEAARIAAKEDIRIYTIGVGTPEGGRIPEGRDVWGRQMFKIYQGREVITKLDDAELKRIASITGGKYYRLDDSRVFRDIVRDISRMEENETRKREHIR